MADPNTTSFILRRVPRPFWRRVKMMAAKREETVRDAIMRLLADYIK